MRDWNPGLTDQPDDLLVRRVEHLERGIGGDEFAVDQAGVSVGHWSLPWVGLPKAPGRFESGCGLQPNMASRLANGYCGNACETVWTRPDAMLGWQPTGPRMRTRTDVR